MPPAPVTYHWALAPVTIINPPTFTEYHADIALPAGHTLRRLLLSEPFFYWKRGSVLSDDQEIYFVHMEVKYGAAEGAPILYRSTRSLKTVLCMNPVGVTEAWYSQHYGADLELGFNERVQRGGYYAPAQTLRLSWSIYSSGDGEEILAGQANTPFRALYSTLDAP